MSNTRKRRAPRPSRTTLVEVAPARCECRHRYEPDGVCTRDATTRVTVVCGVEGCDCAAVVHLVCDHCLAIWRTGAVSDGVELRTRPL